MAVITLILKFQSRKCQAKFNKKIEKQLFSFCIFKNCSHIAKEIKKLVNTGSYCICLLKIFFNNIQSYRGLFLELFCTLLI